MSHANWDFSINKLLVVMTHQKLNNCNLFVMKTDSIQVP